MKKSYQYAELSITNHNNWVYLRLGVKDKQRIGTDESDFWQELDNMAQDSWQVKAVYNQEQSLCYLLEKLRAKNDK
jgi:hypothetical protein